MKHIETKTQTLLIMLLFLFFGITQAIAQEKNPQTVIIRVFEIRKGKTSSHMTITSPDGLTKSIKLSNIDIEGFEGESENGVIIQTEINLWKKKGFELDGMSTQTTYVGGIITTILLSKND